MDGPHIRRRLNLEIGHLEFLDGIDTHVVIGDRFVPRRIDIELPGAGDQPALAMTIEVHHDVPLCTHLELRMVPGRREIRRRDLDAIDLETWIETFVAAAADRITEQHDGVIATVNTDPAEIRDGIATIRAARQVSRRKLTPDDLLKVADLYQQAPQGGLGRVQAAFGVHKVTATRYIKRARTEGFLPPKES